MQQIVIPKPGAPGVLRLEEAADPTPMAGEVRIRTVAAGINFADIMARLGLYPDAPPFPCVVGYEAAGVVDAVGAGVTDIKEGDQAVALTRFGGYSTVVCTPQAQVVKAPPGADLHALAALPVQYLTAWLMLVHLGNVRAGEKVLVHSVGGGVGLAAVQICKWRGAEVIGTASAGKHERLRAMGVDHCIDYRTQDFAVEVKRITDGRGVDIVLDAQGGSSFRKSYESLADLGRLFLFGAANLATGEKRNLIAVLRGLLSMPKFGSIPLMDQNRGVFGVNLGHLWHRVDDLRGMLGEITGLVADGTFKPVIDATFPFAQAAEAHAYIQARKNFGKVLLTVA
ncbi:MAG: zinc-binding dehydrogenase [Myxococcales bacterium]|nr:zinc-binding dehydrogenase [Myxococcales bacterium]